MCTYLQGKRKAINMSFFYKVIYFRECSPGDFLGAQSFHQVQNAAHSTSWQYWHLSST